MNVIEKILACRVSSAVTCSSNPRSDRALTVVTLSVVLATVLQPALSQAQEDRTLIRAQTIYTADGEVISPGQVLIKDGKISFVGKEIELGLPANEIDVHTLMPGIVNASSSAGLAGGSGEVSREVTPDFETLNAIDWRSRDFREAIDEGVTTVQVLPATESVFAGFACVMKTAGDVEQRVIEDRNGIVVAMCSDPTSRNRSRSRPDSIYVRLPTNRMGVVWIIRNSLHQAALGEKAVGLDPQTQSVLNEILDGTHPVLSVSRADFDIRSALELGETYGFLPTIYGGDEVYRMIDEFAATGAPLVYTALTTNSSGRALRGAEGTDLRWNVAGKMHDAGIAFCLAGDNLLDQARFAVRFGLSKDQALRSITIEPAKVLRLEKQIGSITVGKSADLVALSGDPLQPTSSVQWTMVDGKIYGRNESK